MWLFLPLFQDLNTALNISDQVTDYNGDGEIGEIHALTDDHRGGWAM